MARGYKPGETTHGFKVIEQVGSICDGRGRRRGIYLVCCPVCGATVQMDVAQLAYRKDCGCTEREKCKSTSQVNKLHSAKKDQPWMDEGEIYRSWKSMRSRTEGITILAQLNGVSEKVIEAIIRRRKEADPSFQKTTVAT